MNYSLSKKNGGIILFKKIFIVFIVSVLILSFTGCNESNITDINTTNFSDKKITIQAVTYFTGDDQWAKAWEYAINDYMSKNPGIKIENDATPSPNDAIRTRINADVQSGLVPDVLFYFNGVDAQPLVESGKVIAWNDELSKDPDWGSNFLTFPIKASNFNGKLYALPYIGYYEGLFINKDLFSKNNVKVPETWDELLEACDAFNEKEIIPMAQSLKDPRYLWELTTLSAGGPKSHLKENAYDPSWLVALNAIKTLYDRNAFPPDAQNLTDEQARSLFTSSDNKAAMFISGSWIAGSLEGNKYQMIYLPVVPDGFGSRKDIVAGCGSGWFMNSEKNEENGGESLKFIKYMTSPEIMSIFAEAGGVPMIRTKSQITHEYLLNASTKSNPIDSFLSKDAFNAINDNIYNFLTGETDAQKLLDDSKVLNE